MNGSRYYGVRVEGAKYGVGFGSALAIAISYTNNHSIPVGDHPRYPGLALRDLCRAVRLIRRSPHERHLHPVAGRLGPCRHSAASFPMQLHGIDVRGGADHAAQQPAGLSRPSAAGCSMCNWSPTSCAGSRSAAAVDDAQMLLVGLSRLGRHRPGGCRVRRQRKAKNPALGYCCDPVLGDRDRGMFVRSDLPPLVRDELCPLADIITPNHFEFEYLCGAKAATTGEVIRQAGALMARGPSTIIVTSAELT